MAKIYSRRKVLELVDLSATTLWRLEKSNQFVKRRQLSPGKVGYDGDAVDQWIEARPLVANSGLRGGVDK